MLNYINFDLSQVKKCQISIPNIDNLLHQFKIQRILTRVGISKVRGVAPIMIIFIFFVMTFNRRRSIAEGLKFMDVYKSKSACYEFIDNPNYN